MLMYLEKISDVHVILLNMEPDMDLIYLFRTSNPVHSTNSETLVSISIPDPYTRYVDMFFLCLAKEYFSMA